jgi:hypothetical protein
MTGIGSEEQSFNHAGGSERVAVTLGSPQQLE